MGCSQTVPHIVQPLPHANQSPTHQKQDVPDVRIIPMYAAFTPMEINQIHLNPHPQQIKKPLTPTYQFPVVYNRSKSQNDIRKLQPQKEQIKLQLPTKLVKIKRIEHFAEGKNIKTVAFKSLHNNLYVNVDLNHSFLMALSKQISVSERFHMIMFDEVGVFALRSCANNKFLTIEENSNILLAKSDKIIDRELFTMVPDANISHIYHPVARMFVVTENQGKTPLLADRLVVGYKQAFEIIVL